MLRPSVTQTYPDTKPDLPARTRGVIALKEENCTVCYKCSRACPDWCIYIDAHKETHEPAAGGKGRSVKVLDRFAIDFALCMYCGICVEVCPFDALFWSPEFEYAEYDIHEMTHEKERLEDWTYTVLPPPPPELEEPSFPGRRLPQAPAPVQAAAAVLVAPPAAPAAAAVPGAAVAERPVRAPRVEAEPDQATYERVLAGRAGEGDRPTDRGGPGEGRRPEGRPAKAEAAAGGAR